MDLGRKVIRSGIWLQSSKFLQFGSHIIVTSILARLLTPKDFGLIGIVTVFIFFVSIFTNISLGAAIIQKKDVSQIQLSTLYWLNFILGLITWAAVVGAAPFAARFYGNPELVKLLRIICINFLLTPIFGIHRRLMEKNLQFSTLSKINVISSVGSGLVGIGLAFLGFGVYSLVWQSISLNIFYLICINISNKWHPNFCWSWKKTKDMIYFSLKMKGSKLTSYFDNNIDFMVLSKLLSTQLFGYYSLAYRIIFFPVRRVTYTFTEILFPTFSKIQDDLKRIKTAYLKSIQIIAIFVFPVTITLALFAKPIVFLVLGEKWLPMADVILVISSIGALQAIDLVSVAIYPAINKLEISIKLGIFATVLTGIAAFIGSSHGLIGAAIAILIARIIIFIIRMIVLKIFIPFTYNELLKYLSGPILGSISILIIFFILPIENVYTWFELIRSLALYFALYTGLILLINFKDLKYVFSRIWSRA